MKALHTSQIVTPIRTDSGLKVWLDIQWFDQLISSINFSTKESPLAMEPLAAIWLESFKRYWDKPLASTTRSALMALPLELEGSHHQRRVWSALQQIPMGQTTSYGVLSKQLDSSPRAVAGACRTNPVVLVVPCHRVVSKNGLGGFMGATEGDPIDIKRWLINHER